MWKAKYISKNDSYWRTFYADDMREAIIMAKRYARKGYICQRYFKIKNV